MRILVILIGGVALALLLWYIYLLMKGDDKA